MANSNRILVWVIVVFLVLHPYFCCAVPFFSLYNRSIEIPQHLSFNSVPPSADSSCDHPLKDPADSANIYAISDVKESPPDGRGIARKPPLKLHLKHRTVSEPAAAGEKSKRERLMDSAHGDFSRIQTLFRRIIEKKNMNSETRLAEQSAINLESKPAMPMPPELAGRLMATLESGVPLGSGEYFMDVFVGTPPRHFSLILDTGSDLNWLQCLPCHDCFPQHGPVYDPASSSSFSPVACGDPRCALVSSPDPPQLCRDPHQPCPYFYWYGDRSNTTGDLALEAFTVNLTVSPHSVGAAGGVLLSRRVDSVIFGCGHWNRGLFHGAAGLLGLGRGPLSFSSQLRSLYGHTFSYCLVDRNSDLTVSSKLIFGEDQTLLSHPNLNFTSLVAGKDNATDTFYYVHIKGIMVGGELLHIPAEAWELSKDGGGGTIIDSGTTLSYFAEPAYKEIRKAFVEKVKGYPAVEEFPVLSPCYNVTGAEKVEVPEFAIAFADGAVWEFPPENYFIRLEPEGIMCLAILGTPRSSLSIIGNYQQQNFHILYDTERSRLGFAPMRCAEV